MDQNSYQDFSTGQPDNRFSNNGDRNFVHHSALHSMRNSLSNVLDQMDTLMNNIFGITHSLQQIAMNLQRLLNGETVEEQTITIDDSTLHSNILINDESINSSRKQPLTKKLNPVKSHQETSGIEWITDFDFKGKDIFQTKSKRQENPMSSTILKYKNSIVPHSIDNVECSRNSYYHDDDDLTFERNLNPIQFVLSDDEDQDDQHVDSNKTRQILKNKKKKQVVCNDNENKVAVEQYSKKQKCIKQSTSSSTNVSKNTKKTNLRPRKK